jgi:AraC-like DNA-binding protein
VHVDARGRSQCVQCNLTPLGAVRLLGMPLEALANRTVPMHTVLGQFGDELVARLHEARSWDERFAVIERGWRARLARAAAIPAVVAQAWHALETSGGNASIEGLARDLACSRKRLAREFRAHIGLSPKLMGRILRFGRVVDQLHASGGRRLSEVAHACGYYDHAHFDRDFQDFAGCSPSAYLALRDPDFGVIVGSQ